MRKDASQHKPFYTQLGENVRTWRDRRKLSQGALAALVGMTRTSLTNIESGRQHPPLHTFCAIAETLKVEVTELLPERRAASTEQIDVKALAGNQVRGADELAFITTGIGGKGTEHGDNTKKKNSGNGRRASR
jgi:transcriptional regulator with XRE-family HTH domain